MSAGTTPAPKTRSSLESSPLSWNLVCTENSRWRRLPAHAFKILAAIYSAWLIALIITSVVGQAALFILLNSVRRYADSVLPKMLIFRHTQISPIIVRSRPFSSA